MASEQSSNAQVGGGTDSSAEAFPRSFLHTVNAWRKRVLEMLTSRRQTELWPQSGDPARSGMRSEPSSRPRDEGERTSSRSTLPLTNTSESQSVALPFDPPSTSESKRTTCGSAAVATESRADVRPVYTFGQ